MMLNKNKNKHYTNLSLIPNKTTLVLSAQGKKSVHIKSFYQNFSHICTS